MDNPEQLATLGTQDRKKTSKQKNKKTKKQKRNTANKDDQQHGPKPG
jgi:hypothetical protein